MMLCSAVVFLQAQGSTIELYLILLTKTKADGEVSPPNLLDFEFSPQFLLNQELSSHDDDDWFFLFFVK